MKDVYKMTVRFDLTDARERYLAEYMQTLDVKKYQSRNQFVLDAIADYVDLQSRSPESSTMRISEISFLRKCGLACRSKLRSAGCKSCFKCRSTGGSRSGIFWTTSNYLIDGTMTANFKTDIKIDGKMPSYQNNILINSIRHRRTVGINTPWLCLIL